MTYEAVIYDGLESDTMTGKAVYPTWYNNFYDAISIAHSKEYPVQKVFNKTLSNIRNGLTSTKTIFEFQNEVLKEYKAVYSSKDYFNKDNRTCERTVLIFDSEEDFLVFSVKYS